MFFRTQLLTSTLLVVSSVLGAPSERRDWADPCKGFGSRATSSVDSFRIAAYKPNSETEADGLIQNWAASPSEPYSTTLTVGPINGDSTEVHHLRDGGLTGFAPGGQWTTGIEVKDNDVPYFVVSGRSPPPPAPVWCAVKNDDVTGDALGYDFLAANGRYDAWSLCREESTNSVRLAYNVDTSKGNGHLDVKSCLPVYLRIIPAED